MISSLPAHLRALALAYARAITLLSLPPLCACAVQPSEECRQYIACQTEYDAAAQTGPTEFSDYEDNGVCWQSADNAALCTERCQAALEALREAAANANIDAASCG